MYNLDSFEKSSTPQQLCHHINGVCWFVHTFQLLKVSMVETSHDVDLVDNALHRFGGFVETSFRESFDCKMLSIF